MPRIKGLLRRKLQKMLREREKRKVIEVTRKAAEERIRQEEYSKERKRLIRIRAREEAAKSMEKKDILGRLFELPESPITLGASKNGKKRKKGKILNLEDIL